MRKNYFPWHGMLLFVFMLSGCSKPHGIKEISLEELIHSNPQSCKWIRSNYTKTKAVQFDASLRKNLCLYDRSHDSAIDSSIKYLVIQLYHNNPYSLCIYLYFYGQHTNEEKTTHQGGETSNAKITAQIGILPDLPVQLIFPLSHLDNQHIFMQRFPRQLKGVVLGQRMDLSDLSRLCMSYTPCEEGYQGKVEIHRVYFSSQLPPPLPSPGIPMVDQFGQWNSHEWPGKIHHEEELIKQSACLEKETKEARFPSSWSRYGGYKNKRFLATGFFRTHYDGKRWWLVDPEGYVFLSLGMDCVRDLSPCLLSNNHDLFAWLPDSTDKVYRNAYLKRGTDLMVDFYRINLMRTYGENWKNKWDEMTPLMLKKYLFNTIANWSDIAMARKSGMPYVYPMKNFPSTGVTLFRDFPDVFSPEYHNQAILYARQLDSLKDDPCLIGYFLNNEPHWAFGNFNLAYEMLAVAETSETKKALIQWLKSKYNNDLHQFNKTWNKNFSAFEDLLSCTIKEKNEISAAAYQDLYDFTKIMVRKYISEVCREVKKVDPNHLNLGLRYAWISSDLCYEAGTAFDVFSINSYANPAPAPHMLEEITRRSGKPVMIGEFHFGALDRGLPATGIQAAENQQARGEAYRYYVEQTFSLPNVIGIHYFQWIDQPVTGRYDGENYNIGFVDVCNQPYEELAQAARLTHERIYSIATRKIKPYNKIIKKVPQVYY